MAAFQPPIIGDRHRFSREETGKDFHHPLMDEPGSHQAQVSPAILYHKHPVHLARGHYGAGWHKQSPGV
jgi:hypothetical protein